MHHSKDTDVFKYPLFVLRFLGLYSDRKNKLPAIIGSLYSCVLFFLLITTVLQLLQFRANVFDFIGYLEELFGFSQHLTKILVMVYQQRKFHLLLNFSKQSWSIKTIPMEMNVRLERILRNNVRLQLCFFCGAVGTACTSIISLFFGKVVPVGSWNSDFNALYKLVVISQSIVLLPICLYVIAFDCMFLAFCVQSVTQFKILCYHLKQLKISKISNGSQHEQFEYLKRCIEYHVSLLRFLKDLQETYSPAIAGEYLTITPVLCSQMYALFESEELSLLFRYVVVCLTCVMQLAFYCLPADFATSEALLVSNAIYDSDWYISDAFNRRKDISFMTQISQQQVSFSAGGILEINARSLLSVLKMSWSACTVMRALKWKFSNKNL